MRFYRPNIIKYGIYLSVLAVPLGKLIYLPGTGGSGITAAAMLLPIATLGYILKRRFSYQITIIPLAMFILAVLSLVSLDDLAMLGVYNYREISGYYSGETGTRDSVLGRLVFLVALLVTYIAVVAMAKENRLAILRLWMWFTRGVVIASVAGVAIFAGIAYRVFDAGAISGISAHSHIVQTGAFDFYRFNPGANVNQFGKYAAIGLAFTLLIQGPYKFRSSVICLLGFALVASLTRSAWLGFLLGLFSVAVHMPSFRKQLGVMLSAGIALVGITASVFVFVPDSVLIMVGQRLDFSPGAGGSERLIKVEHVLHTIANAGLVTQLFGNGWATNLYVHSVPFQLLYEVGIVGFVLGTLVMIGLWWRLHYKFAFSEPYLNFLRVAFTVTTIDMLLQHSLYHPSTWLVLASVAAYSGRRSVESKGP